MKFFLFTLALILCSIHLNAEDTGSVTGAEITEVGLYSARIVKEFDVPNITSGKYHGLESFTLIQATTNVPARIGTRFGFRYTIHGTPTNAPIVLKMVGEHPPLKDPKTGRIQARDVYQLQTSICETYTSFSLDEDWELVPGKWTFEVWHRDKKLCEQSFLVVAPTEKQDKR